MGGKSLQLYERRLLFEFFLHYYFFYGKQEGEEITKYFNISKALAKQSIVLGQHRVGRTGFIV